MGARSPRSSLGFALVTGVVSTIPIWRAPRQVRTAVIAGTGIAAGIGGYVALRHPESLGVDRPAATTVQSVGLGSLAAGVVAGSTAVAFTADRVFEQFLVRRGVTHPRAAMGVAGGVLSWAMDVLERRVEKS